MFWSRSVSRWVSLVCAGFVLSACGVIQQQQTCGPSNCSGCCSYGSCFAPSGPNCAAGAACSSCGYDSGFTERPFDSGFPPGGFDSGFPRGGGFDGGFFFCFTDAGTGVNPEPLVESSPPPPPVSGGTLLVSKDGTLAIASDPDRDLVWVVDLARLAVVSKLNLQPGDEPGRLVEDGARRIHVALRHGGAVVSFGLGSLAGDAGAPDGGVPAVSGAVRSSVCPEPRGIAYDPASDLVHVACTGGELVSLPAAGGLPVRTLRLDRDLRDVIVDGNQLQVSRFKMAEHLVVDANGAVTTRVGQSASGRSAAWQTRPMAGGSLISAHQLASTGTVDTCVGYGSTAQSPGILVSAIDFVRPSEAQPLGPSLQLGNAVLPVDLAVSPSGTEVSVAAYGSDMVFTIAVTPAPAGCTPGRCFPSAALAGTTSFPEPIAVAYDAAGFLLIQNRQSLLYRGTSVVLSPDARQHTGHRLFHRNAGRGIACASCHMEGRDDGRVWTFSDSGPRRTQSVAGGILARAPYHWTANLPTMSSLMGEVFVKRMGGLTPTPEQVGALGRWIDSVPAPREPAPLNPSAVQVGAALFNDSTVGCAGCHGGGLLTNGIVVDVGTGGAFKVPSLLGVGARAPFLHDGCAGTLLDRFGPCGGNRHGSTAQLTPDQLKSLAAYLETL